MRQDSKFKALLNYIVLSCLRVKGKAGHAGYMPLTPVLRKQRQAFKVSLGYMRPYHKITKYYNTTHDLSPQTTLPQENRY